MRRIHLLAIMAVCTTLVQPLAAQDPTEKKTAPPPGKKATETEGIQQKELQQNKTPAWQTLFDGKQMKGWEVVKGIDYEDAGQVQVKDGSLLVGEGQPATGVRWTGKFPKTNYEVELEGQRVDGSDFFCGMSFPVGDGALTLILGGWGGWVTGLSCIDGYRAIDNETCSSVEFKNKKWYHIRVRVTDKKVTGYVDDKWICGLETEHRKLTVTSEMEPCLPFGFATWNTTGALRNIQYRLLPDDLPDEEGDKR